MATKTCEQMVKEHGSALSAIAAVHVDTWASQMQVGQANRLLYMALQELAKRDGRKS